MATANIITPTQQPRNTGGLETVLAELDATISILSHQPESDTVATHAMLRASTARACLHDLIGSPEIKRLQNAIESMDCFAHDGFDAISTMASVALTAMEVPGSTDNETLARVLNVIRDQAQQTFDNIGCQAEEVGCGWNDLASERRAAARRFEMGVSHA